MTSHGQTQVTTAYGNRPESPQSEVKCVWKPTSHSPPLQTQIRWGSANLDRQACWQVCVSWVAGSPLLWSTSDTHTLLTDHWWPVELLKIQFSMILSQFTSQGHLVLLNSLLIPEFLKMWQAWILLIKCWVEVKESQKYLTFLLLSTPDDVPSLVLRL